MHSGTSRGIHNTRVPKEFHLPILDACSRNDDARLEWLLGQGAKPEGIHVACEANAADALIILLRAGANPNEKAKSGLRPLHACCVCDAADCVSILLSCGANPLLTDNYGLTMHNYIDLFGAFRASQALSSYFPST